MRRLLLALLLLLLLPTAASAQVVADPSLDDPHFTPEAPGQLTISLMGTWLSERNHVDLIVALDASGSVGSDGYERSRAFASSLLAELPAERFAAGGTPRRWTESPAIRCATPPPQTRTDTAPRPGPHPLARGSASV